MKKIILILLTLISSYTIKAQKNFQGEITYSLHTSTGDRPDAILKIYFGSNKIKLRFKEKEEFDKEEIIVLLDSSTKYIINTKAKTYRQKPLVVNTRSKQLEKRTISGYTTNPLKNENTGLESLFGGSMQSANVVFYLADSLYYTIPAAFIGNAELIAIQKNKIVLGADILFNKGSYEVSDSTEKDDLIKVEAIEIMPRVMNDDEFNIPADYATKENNDYEPSADTTEIEKMPVTVDTTVIQYPAKKKDVKKPVKPNNSKNNTKPAAARKKE